MLAEYEQHLSRLPISMHTRRNYLARVRGYLGWLADLPDGHKALSDPGERDFAVREFKSWLLQKGRSSNTVNSTLAAIDNLYLYIGLGPARVKRQEPPKLAPRALDLDEQRRFLRAVATSKHLRDRTVAMLMLHCGIRLSEVMNLNIGDVVMTARRHQLIIRCGKNSKRRVIPINREAAEVLQTYLLARRANVPDAALFLSRQGNRLSTQAIDRLLRRFGRDSGVEVSSHRLRHVFLTQLVRAGVDIVTVAEIAGHAKIDTTRRYSLPTADVMIAAVEKISYAASP
jgi:integrase/recombinase XerC